MLEEWTESTRETGFTCLGARLRNAAWTKGAAYLPVVGISRLIFLISSQCSPRLTWIEVGDELMRVLFASFPVGVLVLVPVGCLRVIPGKVQIKTLMNIRCKVALQTEMDTTTKFLDSAKNQ